MNNESSFNALKAAVEKIGGQSAMARLISTELRPIRQGHVWMWLNRNRKLPPEFVLAVESLTGVSRYALRPDIFGGFSDTHCAAPSSFPTPECAEVNPLPAPRAARPSIFPFIPCHDSQAEVRG